jgi:class 3 adenylate cyclase
MSVLFAATHPDRVSRLVLYSPAARGSDVVTPELRQSLLDIFEQSWGRGDLAPIWAPSRADDPEFIAAWARFERAAVSPSVARALLEMTTESNVTDILPSIRVPTLVLHRRDDTMIPIALGREVADAIPGARFVELDGRDQLAFAGDWQAIVDEVEEFLTGQRSEREPDRALMTVLFTDVVDSTRHAAELGDSGWRDKLAAHDRLVRRELARERGREVKTVGDGFVATFDGPARSIRCARAILDGARGIGLEVRAGVHTGEVEIVGDDIAGLAVHIAARVMSQAGPGEVLVSSTVKDLVVGSGLEFADRGAHELKGVPGEWRLLAA